MEINMEILKYSEKRDYGFIMKSCENERWESFYTDKKDDYKKALESSYTYVLYENGAYCGFIRGITDGFFTLFIPEIIIDAEYRHRGYGTALINRLRAEFPDTRTDLLSDNDAFYISQGFHKLGTGMRKPFPTEGR